VPVAQRRALGNKKMILFSSKELERKLASSSIDSWDKAKYVIVLFVIYSFSGPVYVLTPSFGPHPPVGTLIASPISVLFIILATYFGIKKCYLTNKATDDVDFIGRFVVLSIPMTLKFILVLLPIFLLFVIILSTLSGHQAARNTFSYSPYLMGPIGTYVFYQFLSGSFRRISVLINQQRNNFLTSGSRRA
jgi:hypothetical protein